MDDIFETAKGGDLGIAAIVGASGYGDLVLLTNWDGANLWEKNY